MKYSVQIMANAMGISIADTLQLLRQNGIMVTDADSVLDDQQMEQLRQVMQSLDQKNAAPEIAVTSPSINVGINTNINTEIVEKSKNALDRYAHDFKILVDTCSLMHDKIEKFYHHILPFLQRYHTQLVVPRRVIDELEKHQASLDAEKQQKAIRALTLLQKARQEELVRILGDEDDNFADNVFHSVFIKYRMKYNLLLITQDYKLSNDILNFNNSQSVLSKYKVHVKKINMYGFLSSPGKNNNTVIYTHEPTIKDEEKFALVNQVIKYSELDNRMTVHCIPQENDTVIAGSGEYIYLLQSIGGGGEGCVYVTDKKNIVAKIYKKETITKEKHEKIKRMISKKIQYDGICWPIDILYNTDREFIGYLMPMARGKEIQKSLFIKPVLLENFPNWKKRDTVELCITILEKIEYLHARNIIMGDINPGNILVNSSKDVYFVDTDSYQIEGFPCPVGTIPFTAQEIFMDNAVWKRQGKTRSYSDYLRTFENEYFSIAVLLFMIMLPGKHPYSLQGGESIEDNIMNMDFAYPRGDASNGRTPNGPWRFIWSHLTRKIKDAFYETFRMGEVHSQPKSRFNATQWKRFMKIYLNLLDSGKLAEQDVMSLELFPNRRKKIAKLTYVKCRLCNEEVPEDNLEQGICHSCLRDGEAYHCKRCGKEIVYSNYVKYVSYGKKYDMCQACHKWGNDVYETKTCIVCSKTFTIPNWMHEAYEEKNWNSPKRCPACQEKKKDFAHNLYQSIPSHTSSTPDLSGILGMFSKVFKF